MSDPNPTDQTDAPTALAPATGSALFVGGANDGKRMAVPNLLVIRLPLPQDQQTSWRGIETEDYRKERMATQNRVFEFYVSASMSLEAALARLLAHYSPNGKLSD